jgi:hypothetical protein
MAFVEDEKAFQFESRLLGLSFENSNRLQDG